MRFRLRLLLIALLPWLQPLRAQSTLNASHDLVRLGIASTNLTPNQPTLDATPLLTQALNYAAANAISVLQVDKGTYYFLTSQNSFVHVGFPTLNGMTVDFQGSDLILGQPALGGFWLSNCHNTVLENFTLDYAKLPFTQLTVVSVNQTTRQIQYTPMPNWPDATTFNQTDVASSGGGFYFFIFRNGHPAPDLSRMQTAAPFTSTQMTVMSDSNTATFLPRIRPGDTLVLSARGGGDPIQANGCDGCTLRNIRIYSASSWGFEVLNSQNSIVDHVYSMPKPGSDRLISTNADGLTLSQPGPNNIYRFNRAIRTLDDGISPHSLLLGLVTSQASQQVQFTRQFRLTVSNESPVTFENAGTGEILGTAVIVSQSPPAPVNAGETVTATFDRPLPANLTGAAIYTTDPNQRGTNTLLERNTVQDQVFARGITVWGLMNTTLRGNYVWRCAWDAILGLHHMVPTAWMAPPLVNVTFSQNVLDSADTSYGGAGWTGGITIEGGGNPNFQPLSASPNSNIQITANYIGNPGLSAVQVQNTASASVTGNYFQSVGATPCVNGLVFNSYLTCQASYGQPVVTSNSPSPSISGNTVDNASISAYVTDTSFTRLAAFAPGSTVRLNGYNIGIASPSTITLLDADAHTWNVTAQVSTTHSVDFQIPSGVGLGGAAVFSISGAVKYAGTLFLDTVDNIPAVNGCAYWVGPSTINVPASGGKIELLVVTQSNCAFQTTSLSTFGAIAGGGTGTGVVEATVASNTEMPRAVLVEIAGYQIPLAQAGTTNYSLRQAATASASSNASNTPDKAVDGNTQTLWNSGAPAPGWIQIALPANAVVSTVRLTVFASAASTTQTVRISARGADGSLTALKTITTTNHDFDLVPVALDTPLSGASAIRIDTLQLAPSGFPGWREIELLSPAPPVVSSVAVSSSSNAIIAQNTWISVFGTNLATGARVWQSADIVNDQMPQQLDGVSVTVNNKPAFVEYISGGQVNILSPVDSAQGQVQIQLKNGGGTSAAYAVTERGAAAAFFLFGAGPYVAATHADGSYVGPATLYPGLSTPAKPGEIIVLYGTGFGQTTPAVVNGSDIQSGNLPSQPQVTIGGASAEVQFAGVISPGLYQFNVVVPASVPDGDNIISASYGGSTTQAGLAVAVHR